MTKKYLLIYRDDPSVWATPPSPEEMQAVMAKWGVWIEKFMKAGIMVDPGDALLPGGKVIRKKGPSTDGPFIEAKEVLGGYSVIKVDSLEAAIEVAKECPHYGDGTSTEIRELAGMGG